MVSRPVFCRYDAPRTAARDVGQVAIFLNGATIEPGQWSAGNVARDRTVNPIGVLVVATEIAVFSGTSGRLVVRGSHAWPCCRVGRWCAHAGSVCCGAYPVRA